MDRQGERVAHADVPHPARTGRGVDHRQPKRAARLMERAAPNPGRSGGPEDGRCRLDRDAVRSQPAAGRPRARGRRGLLGPRRTRALRCARVVFLHALRRALPARAHRDPGGPPRANLGGAAGARVEPASVTAPTIMRKGQRASGAVLALLSLPVLLVLVEAVSFRVANRPNGSFMSSGRKREYVLYVPRSYDRAKPTALVISLHGAGMWGAAQKETSQWNRVADEHGFIVGYPSGEGGGGPRAWHEGGEAGPDRKSTRLNSSHSQISYAVFCLKKKNAGCVSVPRSRQRAVTGAQTLLSLCSSNGPTVAAPSDTQDAAPTTVSHPPPASPRRLLS